MNSYDIYKGYSDMAKGKNLDPKVMSMGGIQDPRGMSMNGYADPRTASMGGFQNPNPNIVGNPYNQNNMNSLYKTNFMDGRGDFDAK